jgi:ubiquinone/menaquinone biosynthesis C-methylase UbiE
VEIGGGGRPKRAIAPEVGNVFAFDLSAEMLALARSSVEAANASFNRAETPALAEIADNSADAFFAHCVFHHLPDLDVLRACPNTAARVLKPGGRLIFTMTRLLSEICTVSISLLLVFALMLAETRGIETISLPGRDRESRCS